MRIEPADLQRVVNGILSDYAEDVREAVDEATTETAADAVKKLKTNSMPFKDNTYSKGWTKTVTRNRLYSQATVYNRTEGRLTHLLEHGHALRNGGRARAFPHIAPVNDQVPEVFEEKLEAALR